MKLRHSLSIFGLVAMLGLGVGVGLASGQKPVAEAKADSVTLYCASSRYTHAYLWKDDGPKNADFPGVEMTLVSENLHSITFDSTIGYEKVIFAAGDKSSQSADQTINTTDPYFVDGWNDWSDESPIGFYFLGDFEDSWEVTSTSTKMQRDVGTNSLLLNNYTFTCATDDTSRYFKAVHFNGTSTTWYNATAVNNYGVEMPDGSNLWYQDSGDCNPAIYFKNAGSYTADIQVVLGANQYTNTYNIAKPCNVTISIAGGSAEPMVSYPANFYEYTADFLNVAAGSTISFSQDYTPHSDINNNIRNGHILAGGDITITYNKSTKSVWVTGYNRGLADELKLFCERLITYTVGAGVCDDPTTTITESIPTWTYFSNWYNSASFEGYRESFKTAVAGARYGNDILYTSLLDEAGCRYAHLVKKFGLTGFAGDIVVPSSRTVASPLASESNNTTIIITIAISSVAVLAIIGGYFYFRKRKEDK